MPEDCEGSEQAPRRQHVRGQREWRDGRLIIWTGHPPPEEQVARQVRCSSGYTLGIATADGAKLFMPREIVRSSPAPQSPSNDGASVMAQLQRLSGSGDPRYISRELPPLETIAASLGAGWTAQRVVAALFWLEQEGQITMRHGSSMGAAAGALAVRLSGTQAVLRNAACPDTVRL